MSIGLFVLRYNFFGDIMYLRIKDRDMTQKEISAMLFCDQSLYSKYERGERDIPLSLIIKLADYYSVSIDYLVGRTNNPNMH